MMLSQVLLGMLIGVALTFIYAMYKVSKLVEEYDKQVAITTEDSKLRVVVEKAQQTYYCYDVDKEVFVCQGSNLQELSKSFSVRYPDKLMYIVGGDSEALRELMPKNS